ncbi:hypothetical protein SLS53_009311 [Cytospora paraplurivora]|uniref:Cyclochlorotine biosynthesis protein O n=1 Tax=Cytospora paraplurivora TaxID=2898453 RepID=A0AAN9TVE9_9PEZI
MKKLSSVRWGIIGSRTDTYEGDGSVSQLLNEEYRKLPEQGQTWRKYIPWVIHGTIFALYLILLPINLNILHGQKAQGYCSNKTHAYSPINDVLEEDYVDYWFKGSLWYDSPYKGPPTPEVNKAWDELLEYGAISVTAEDIQRIGHNLTAVQYPQELGGGYLAIAMGTHHIHCLRYIWKDHHMAYFPETEATREGAPEMYERHYEHCIDYIRQEIMCNFDPGIIPFYWVNQHDQPTPDGNTFHRCMNWDHIQAWLKDRAVKLPDGFEWHQPPDAKPLPHNP